MKINTSVITGTDQELLAAGTLNKTKMVGNTDVPTPDPTPLVFDLALSEFSDAVDAIPALEAALQAALVVRHDKRETFVGAYTTRALQLEKIAKGNEGIIHNGGMTPRKHSQTIGMLMPPLGLKAKSGRQLATGDVQWKKVYGAASYVTRYGLYAVPTVWIDGPKSMKVTCTIPDLESGMEYVVEVASFGTAGQGPWSAGTTFRAS